MSRRGVALLLGAVVLVSSTGCRQNRPASPPTPVVTQGLVVSSPGFDDGDAIPADFTCSGAGTRPGLQWTLPAKGAAVVRAWAVVVDDPDAPSGEFYHWVVVDLPAAATAVGDRLPSGARELDNSSGTTGWTPPCPPSGTHHYRFTVYGLSAKTGLTADTKLDDAFAEITQSSVITGHTTGTVTHQNN